MNSILSEVRNFQRACQDEIVKNSPSLGLDNRAESFVRLFERQLKQKSEVLDIGGRWGFYSEPLRERGHHLTVLDVVRPSFQKAPVVLYDGKRFPFADKSFDTSLLITVLHHIKDWSGIIEEAKRVTRKTLILVEDTYHHQVGRWWTILRDMIYNFEFIGHPCRFQKPQQWIEGFESAGFSLIEQKKVYTWLAGLRILNHVFVFQVHEG